MRLRRLSPVLLVLFLALIGLVIWWFTRSTAIAPQKAAATPTPAKIDSVKIVAPPIQVELPKAVAVPAHADATPVSVDPQADLKTAIPDIVRLEEAGDFATFDENYYPPGSIAPSIIQRTRTQQEQAAIAAAKSPSLQQQLQQTHEAAARSWEALEVQTPTFNATGDEATYMYSISELTNGQTGARPKTFVKINGKWYVKPPGVKGSLAPAQSN